MEILQCYFIYSVKFTRKYVATIEIHWDSDIKNSKKNVLNPFYVYKFIVFLNQFGTLEA